MKKPQLNNATIIKRVTLKDLLDIGISEDVAKFIIYRQGTELNTGDVGINAEYQIIGPADAEYIAVSTRGAAATLSMFRLVGGCNHLEAFDSDGVEKSEDYDSLTDFDICEFSNDFEIARQELINKYIGKKLRIVARTAEGTAPFGRRYYLFAIEK